MRKPLLLILFLLGKLAMGQLSVNTSPTITQLVQNFIGTGVTISNITYTGGINSRAYFSNGNATNLNLTNGIVLCTGNASLIANPASYLMSTNLGLVGDANLNSINNNCLTYDACILEFDFVPISDTIKFKYVFCSEEYPNYICSQYNDVFAFFISGANPAGGNYTNYNIALIPNTTIPVSVNSVNSGIPGSSYSASGCLSLAYSNYFVNNALINGTTIAFGGFTKPLTAKCHVVPCNTYHLKIAVADGYNGLYDSGVFLEANSFSTNTFDVKNYYADTILGHYAIKGCSDGVIYFKSPATLATPLTINYTIGGTAVNGTDYTTIPNSITIPAGQDSAGILIHPLVNTFTGIKTLILTLTNGCITIKDTLYITDKPNIIVNAGNDTNVCVGKPAVLNASFNGGIMPVTYTWNQGIGNGNHINVTPTVTTTYKVTVSDHCATTATDSMVVKVNPYPLVNLGNDTTLCPGNDLMLDAGNTGASYLWNTNATTKQINVNNNGTYAVKVTTSFGCASSDSIKVSYTTLNVNLGNDTYLCKGDSIVLNAGNSGSTYMWNTGEQNQTIKVWNTGNYWVEVTKTNCSLKDTIKVYVDEKPVIDIGKDTIMCPGDLIILNAGTGYTSYLWSTGSTQATINVNLPGTYTVTVANGGCKATDMIFINECTIEIWVPNSFTPDGNGLNDTFYPVCTDIDNLNLSMYIFNRWGNLIFEGSEKTAIWDGKYLGKLCEEGVYYYLISYTSKLGSTTPNSKHLHGTVTLLKQGRY